MAIDRGLGLVASADPPADGDAVAAPEVDIDQG
jgi:hypothetical protein